MRMFIKSAIAAGVLAAAGTASAATATATFNVTATVLKVCTVTATPLAFGSYTPGSGNLDVTATNNITMRCTKGTGYTVALNPGLAAGATITNRRMRSAAVPANELAYTLYTDAARTLNWGDTGATNAPTGTGTGFATAVNFSVYGRVPDNAVNQNATVAADYSDTITVTVTY